MNHNVFRLLCGLIITASLCFAPSAGARTWKAAAPKPDSYRGALVYDYDTREIVYEDRAHERVDPASLVKMMVVLLTLERVERGELKLSAPVRVSRAASKIGGHQVYLKEGEVFPLQELLRAVVMASANDASFAVAEYAGGTPERFVQLMNARARELGMKDSYFANAHGLPPNKRKGQEANYTSAFDLALLSRELMKFPVARQWAATRTATFRGGKLVLVNTNRRFLQQFPGADGLKTGYHPRGAGFCVVASARRDGRHLVAVLLGASSQRSRLNVVSSLLELGFQGKLPLQSHSERPVLSAPVVVGAASAAGATAYP
jgi:D-alanyl-D-alanine carboxypeptidase (penicillin-binding protein 5/6)